MGYQIVTRLVRKYYASETSPCEVPVTNITASNPCISLYSMTNVCFGRKPLSQPTVAGAHENALRLTLQMTKKPLQQCGREKKKMHVPVYRVDCYVSSTHFWHGPNLYVPLAVSQVVTMDHPLAWCSE